MENNSKIIIQVLKRAEFLKVMDGFGQSFMQPDISIFKQNLTALQEINKTWKLYQKVSPFNTVNERSKILNHLFPLQPLFKEALLEKFLVVLLTVLSDRSHHLLRDEIVSAVHSMAGVEFEAFFSAFVPRFLAQVEGVDDSQRAMLKDSFKPDTVRQHSTGTSDTG